MEPFLVITPTGYTKHYYAGTERIAAQIGKGKFANVNTSIANADSTAAKLTAVNGIATYLANYATQKFAYLNTLPILNTTAKEIYYYHTDHLGSSAWITDSLGVAVQHLAYLPWGEPFVTQKTGNFNPTYTFSGKEKDAETGYSYFGQRFYDSQLSLWISVDPMRGKYPSLSPFVYCANNPLRLIDPNGMEIDWYVPKGANNAVYDKNVNENNVPDGGTYIGKTAHWFGQNQNDMQYYYHGDAEGNLVIQDMTMDITADKVNTTNIPLVLALGLGKKIGKKADDMSITSRFIIHYRTEGGRLYMGNQYETAKVVGKTAFGKFCKKMPCIGIAVDGYMICDAALKYGSNSREFAAETGGVAGSIIAGAALGTVVGGGIPGAIVGGVIGGVAGDMIGRKAGGFMYDHYLQFNYTK